MSFKDKRRHLLDDFLFAVIVLVFIGLMIAMPIILSKRKDRKTYEFIKENPEFTRKIIEIADSVVFKKYD